MKPVRLTMTAFGSFARETVVPFDEFQSGLYLVVGETGAGKTTVFDAIVFALFGTASGTARKPDMMHSDYVERSTDTVVRLEFDHLGKRYAVTRTIHYPKRQGGQGRYGDASLNAVMESPDGPPITGHVAVTRRCEALLGLNADQFRKIVMLAQGEFREFLAADALKKSEILGRLFDSSEYVRYQELLGAARAALAERRKGCREAVELLMQTVFLPPESTPGEEAAVYLPGDPQLLAELDALILREKETAEVLAGEKAAERKAADELHVKRGAAAGDNEKLSELESKTDALRELENRKDEMERLEQRRARGELAVRRCLPMLEKLNTADAAVKQAQASIDLLRRQAQERRAVRDRARAELDQAEASVGRAQELLAEKRRIDDSLPAYKELADTEKKLLDVRKMTEALRQERSSALEQKDAAARSLAADQEALLSLENAEARAVRAQARYDLAKKKADALAGEGGLQKGVEAVRLAAGRLSADEESLTAAAVKAAALSGTYLRLYQAFIGGQAGLLGRELEEALRADGHARCPVCGSEFEEGQPHEFARAVEGTPSQSEVDAAKAAFDAAELARSELYAAVAEQRIALQHRKDFLLARARELLSGDTSWEVLAGEDCLPRAAERFAALLAEAKADLDEAEEGLRQRDALKKRCDALSRRAQELGGRAEDALSRLQEAEKSAAALAERLNAVKSALLFPTLEIAREQSLSLEREIAALTQQAQMRRAAFDAAREAADKADGELAATEKALPDRESARDEALEQFSRALAVCGFTGREDFEAALPPGDGEAWLSQQQKILTAYENDRNNTRQRVEELTEQTALLQKTDLSVLDAALEEAEARYSRAEDAWSRHNALLNNHKDVRRRAARSLEELQKTDGAWERLDKLADLALGASAEGGKLSFERYVMGSIFRQVLEMANRRLDVMSGGRYTLVHTTNAPRANAAAGLEIEVLDASTGRQRGAASLSGGETFQVSLSLALGLSDVVHSRAGGMGLDALFIDEGFGALDSGALDSAISVLNQLTEGDRLVGVISHVDKLSESIPQKLRVKKTALGSQLTPELS